MYVQFSGEEILLLVESCLFHDILGFNFLCTSCILCYHATHIAEIFHIPLLILPTIICIGDGCLEFLITLYFSTLISIPFHLPIPINLSIMPYNTAYSLAISTR